jgi:transcriptional regulator with XRE-family HTH domain
MDINYEVARLIKIARRHCGISQKRFAVACDWTQQYQSQIEGGETKITLVQMVTIIGAVWSLKLGIKNDIGPLIIGFINSLLMFPTKKKPPDEGGKE